MENTGYFKSDEDFKNEYLEKMRECLRLPLSDDESAISRQLRISTDFVKFLGNKQNDRAVIVKELIAGSIDSHMLSYDSFDDIFRVKIINLILTALRFPSLMGDKPVIDIHLTYSDGDTLRETLDLFNRITEDSFIENKIFLNMFNGLLMYFPSDRLLDILNNFHPDYKRMILDHSDYFIKSTKENMENRMVLIRFIREHSGVSDEIKL